MTKEDYIKGIEKSDVRVLSKAITLAESELQDQFELALSIIESFPSNYKSRRIGITGSPGAGKSTFINALGMHLLKEDPTLKIAVLSIDPSSSISGGSILGDKTRMGDLNQMDQVYIRPSASGKQLGGLAKNTRLATLLCEAAGYDTILIESVGVGQAETEMSKLCDLFCLVLNPGGGDDLQGIKRGIVEMAQLIVVNKNDGASSTLAQNTARDYQNALQLLGASETDWKPIILTCSSIEKTGLDQVSSTIDKFFIYLNSDLRKSTRKGQQKYWLIRHLKDQIVQQINQGESTIDQDLESDILPERIARNLAKDFFG
ncbi:MAG: methylmalonyl Co-A mutase-associated GTPase MeaB [Bacteroidia bacterium]